MPLPDSPRINFNPHSPCGERLCQAIMLAGYFGISIHTPHAGSDLQRGVWHHAHRRISIHTPHAGSDGRRSRTAQSRTDFNPHSPCGERPALIWTSTTNCLFQSTLPMRGATPAFRYVRGCTINFNPHSPCGERLPQRHPHSASGKYFNPHSPCGERPPSAPVSPLRPEFQSTLPMRGATYAVCHAVPRRRGFQSTLPMRGATIAGHRHRAVGHISIHTPHAGSDSWFLTSPKSYGNFNPHSPCGERHYVNVGASLCP